MPRHRPPGGLRQPCLASTRWLFHNIKHPSTQTKSETLRPFPNFTKDDIPEFPDSWHLWGKGDRRVEAGGGGGPLAGGGGGGAGEDGRFLREGKGGVKINAH